MDKITISREFNFLDSKIGADCKFLVGADFGDIEEEISGHKAIFSNASPVFEKMFFGSIPENGEDIKVPDIQPEIFHKIVNFFYTGKITIVSVEDAVGIWYAAEKYNIAELIKHIPDYLIKNVQPDNVCNILKFAISFENEILIKNCEKMIEEQISTILQHSSFLEVDWPILSFILDQEVLNISEIEIFKALVRYDNARKNNGDEAKLAKPSSTSAETSRSVDLEVKEDNVSRENVVDPCGEGSSHQEGTETQGVVKANGGNPVKELVKKIRFLTMTAKEFGECVEMSSMLSTSEALSIFVNISTYPCTHQMPEGFCTIKEKRKLNKRKEFRCHHSIKEPATFHFITDRLKDSLVFSTSVDITITGVQLNYPSVFRDGYQTSGKFNHTIELTNADNVKLLYQNVVLDQSDHSKEITFNRPVFINCASCFTMKITLNDIGFGSSYEFYEYHCSSKFQVNGVTFTFGQHSRPCNCKGLIRHIVFTC